MYKKNFPKKKSRQSNYHLKMLVYKSLKLIHEIQKKLKEKLVFAAVQENVL